MLTSVWPRLQVMSHSTCNPPRMRNAPPPRALPRVSATQSEHLSAGCFFYSLARLSLSPVSPWPRGRHPPRIRSWLLSWSPQVSFILFCVLLSTSRVPPPLAYPRPGTLSTVRVSPAGGYLHLPTGVYLHLPIGVSPRSSPPAKHPGCTVHVHSLLLPRVLWNALRQPHLSACDFSSLQAPRVPPLQDHKVSPPRPLLCR